LSWPSFNADRKGGSLGISRKEGTDYFDVLLDEVRREEKGWFGSETRRKKDFEEIV